MRIKLRNATTILLARLIIWLFRGSTIAMRNGIRLLDEKVPDWFLHTRTHPIDVTRIAMNKKEECILGYLFGSYRNGLKKLDLHPYDAGNYGFQVPVAVHYIIDKLDDPSTRTWLDAIAYQDLGATWRSYILRRRYSSDCLHAS
jgi:hypothetical protein